MKIFSDAKTLKKKLKGSYCTFYFLRKLYDDYSNIKKCEDAALHGWPRPFDLTNNGEFNDLTFLI
jgi:hypothetical protein